MTDQEADYERDPGRLDLAALLRAVERLQTKIDRLEAQVLELLINSPTDLSRPSGTFRT
jgi:hypothetical protein